MARRPARMLAVVAGPALGVLAFTAALPTTATVEAAGPPVRPSLAGPRSAAPGSPVAFRLTTRNRSRKPLNRLRAELLLSRDRRPDARDVLLGRETLPTIPARRSRVRLLKGRIPRSTPRGRRFALACLREPRGGDDGRTCVPHPLPIARPNVLIIIADDLGIFEVGKFASGVANGAVAADPAPTPELDQLATDGVRFNHAWSNPVCSPTRATVYTGRYSLSTGVGNALDDPNPNPGVGELKAAEVTLAKYLRPLGYRSALFGKWHVGISPPVGPDGPRVLGGFDLFSGIPTGEIADYYAWERYVNGINMGVETTYATTRAVDDAKRFINGGSGPWFVTVAFNAPHKPFHIPPAALTPTTGAAIAGANCNNAAFSRQCYKAAIEAMDTEIDRLFREAGIDAENTLIIFLGDNGPPDDAVVPGLFPVGRVKGKVYEGGIRVPLIISGPPVVTPDAAIDKPVNATDIFETVADTVGGLPPGKRASSSMVPYLQDPLAVQQRPYAYSERFTDAVGVHSPGSSAADTAAAAFDGRYKVIEEPVPGTGGTGTMGLSHCYDLTADPFELTDLWNAATQTPVECKTLYDAMEADLH